MLLSKTEEMTKGGVLYLTHWHCQQLQKSRLLEKPEWFIKWKFFS